MAKTKYTRAQKQAYYSGMGYSTAYLGKAINFDNPENMQSFKTGYRVGKKMVEKNSSKYPPLGTTKKEYAPKKSVGKSRKSTSNRK